MSIDLDAKIIKKTEKSVKSVLSDLRLVVCGFAS